MIRKMRFITETFVCHGLLIGFILRVTHRRSNFSANPAGHPREVGGDQAKPVTELERNERQKHGHGDAKPEEATVPHNVARAGRNRHS